MIQSKELIEEIKKRPCLWSPSFKFSSDKESRNASWLEVAQALFPDFDELTSAKKNEELAFVKKRWKNIRDHYIKENWKGKTSAYDNSLKFLELSPSTEMVSVPDIHCSLECPKVKMYKWKELIEEIKKRPCLWSSPANKYHSIKKSRDANWLDVAQALFSDFETMNQEKRIEKVGFLKKRWKYMRDHYYKDKKSGKGKNCIHNDALGFLDRPSSVEMKPASAIPEPIEKTEEPSSPLFYDQSSVEMDSNVSLKIIKVEEETSYAASESPDEMELQEVERSSTSKSVKDLCCLNLDSLGNKRFCDLDADESFLLSLLPEMRELSGLQKMDFKIAVLNNLKMARYSGNKGDN